MLTHIFVAALATAFVLGFLVETFSFIRGSIKALVTCLVSLCFSFSWFALADLACVVFAVSFLSLILIELSTKLTAYRQAFVQRVGRQDF